MAAPRALTVAEVADRLGVSVSTVRRLIAAGELAALHVGQRSVRVRESDVDRYLERRNRQ